MGARVITTAGTEANRELCRSLGADAALDYRSPTLDENSVRSPPTTEDSISGGRRSANPRSNAPLA
jgi:hypothetical protein